MITQAEEPSLSWLALPAVMCVLGSEHWLELAEPLERRVGTIALVLSTA